MLHHGTTVYTHSLKKETRNLERKWRKTNLEIFRIVWKNSMSSYRQALKARTEHICKLTDTNQNSGGWCKNNFWGAQTN